MIVFLAIALLFTGVDAEAQCSICTKTASQLSEPAKALNGAVYLMSASLTHHRFYWLALVEDAEEG